MEKFFSTMSKNLLTARLRCAILWPVNQIHGMIDITEGG